MLTLRTIASVNKTHNTTNKKTNTTGNANMIITITKKMTVITMTIILVIMISSDMNTNMKNSHQFHCYEEQQQS